MIDLAGVSPAALVASLMVAATPILLAATGELVVEKSGVLNLGVEGMMIIGAVCGFSLAPSKPALPSLACWQLSRVGSSCPWSSRY